jgi:hypothetical protein
MKRSLIVFIVAGLVLISTGLWFVTSASVCKPIDLLQFGVILIVVGFALFLGYKRLTSERRGEPAEDELSKMKSQSCFISKKTGSIQVYDLKFLVHLLLKEILHQKERYLISNK